MQEQFGQDQGSQQDQISNKIPSSHGSTSEDKGIQEPENENEEKPVVEKKSKEGETLVEEGSN